MEWTVNVLVQKHCVSVITGKKSFEFTNEVEVCFSFIFIQFQSFMSYTECMHVSIKEQFLYEKKLVYKQIVFILFHFHLLFCFIFYHHHHHHYHHHHHLHLIPQFRTPGVGCLHCIPILSSAISSEMFNFLMFSSTALFHVFFGLPNGLLPSTFSSIALLSMLFSSKPSEEMGY